MKLENIAAALRIIWPHISKKYLKRKYCATFAIVVLSLGELFPEYNMISKILASVCLTGTAVDFHKRR